MFKSVRNQLQSSFLIIAGFAVLMLSASCGDLSPKHIMGIDDVINVLNDAIAVTSHESTNWRGEVEKLRQQLIDGGQEGFANQVNEVLQHTVQSTGTEARCTGTFLQKLTVEQLQRIKASITGETVSLTPVICQSDYPSVDIHSHPDVIILDGFNLEPQNIQVISVDHQNQQVDVTGDQHKNVGGGSYQLVVNISGNGIRLPDGGGRLLVQSSNSNDNPLYTIILTTGSNSTYQLGPSYQQTGGGGSGGSEMDLMCPSIYVSIGLVGRSGEFIDQIGLQCGQFNSDGTIGQVNESERAGGSGGSDFSLTCPPNQLLTQVNGRSGERVDQLQIHCTSADGSNSSDNGPVGGSGGGIFYAPCSDGYVVTGIHGRSGDGVDRINLICTQFR